MCEKLVSHPVKPFQSGSPNMIVGPINSGKTFWVKRLLSHQMFMEPVKSILYYYGVHKRAFDEMNNDTNIVAPIKFVQGLPTKDNIDELNDGNFHNIILDDMMETIVKSLDMLQLFTKYCHHCNISAIFISQNVYHQGPYAHSISLNNHVLFLFQNARDLLQMTKLGTQLYPRKCAQFLKVCEINYSKPYSYLVVNCTPSVPSSLKLRTGIFPDETSIVYQITQ